MTTSKPLPPDLAAALIVAQREFTGIQELLLHSPRDVAETHIATILQNYLKEAAKPLVQSIDTLADAVEELSDANNYMGTSAAQVLELLRHPSTPHLRAVATAILETMVTPEDEQIDWMDPDTPPPANGNNKSKEVLVEVVMAILEEEGGGFEHITFTTMPFNYAEGEWDHSVYAGWEPTYEIFRWKYLPAEEQKETGE